MRGSVSVRCRVAAGLLALCTAAAMAADSGWTDRADGTVDDPHGLMWKRCAEGQRWDGARCGGTALPYRWDEARAAAEISRVAGHADWRLPRLDELRRLREGGQAAFPELPAGMAFWTGVAVAHGSDGAFIVYFPADGDPDPADHGVGVLADGHAVRLVRDSAPAPER